LAQPFNTLSILHCCIDVCFRQCGALSQSLKLLDALFVLLNTLLPFVKHFEKGGGKDTGQHTEFIRLHFLLKLFQLGAPLLAIFLHERINHPYHHLIITTDLIEKFTFRHGGE